MKKLFALAAVAAAAATLALAEDREKLVVHEWGTFTSISGEDGVSLEYRPLTGVSDLPSFVHTAYSEDSVRGEAEIGKGSISGNVRMETPVVYFYSDVEKKVSVKVDFRQGRITEFFPRAKYLSSFGSIDWGTFLVKPAGGGSPPEGSAQNHYFRAREVDADLVRVCAPQGTEYEKFLFYRGVGSFGLPLAATLDQVTMRLTGLKDVGTAIVFQNRKGIRTFRTLEGEGQDSVSLPIPLTRGESVEERLVQLLVSRGLYEKEARAMVATWKDSWFEEGLRVLYVLPRKTTDEVLPITIKPAPTELVRVLVGRIEVITPEREKEVVELVSKLGSDEVAEREAAHTALAKAGRFVRPILENALKKGRDAEVNARIQKLLRD